MDKSVKHFFDTFHHGKSLTLREVGSHFHIFYHNGLGTKRLKAKACCFLS